MEENNLSDAGITGYILAKEQRQISSLYNAQKLTQDESQTKCKG